ncbi:hypothetical protein MLD38_036902 [Melastoma candidum]|uniref:Uncharacterized protein n=1 Tax=Melastoma candidum TaxID=119954 RepID=A0ACB9LKY4_9MYRT|nr:hypothetical protein MLD38_036902 [Melastoma candidum]
MAPEYITQGQFSIKSDVFSFGVLVLETVSGRRNLDFQVGEHREVLISRVWRNWCEGKISSIIDPLVKTGYTLDIVRCIHIGLLCVQEDLAIRPTMASIILMLIRHSTTLPVPKQPAFLTASQILPEPGNTSDTLRRNNTESSTGSYLSSELSHTKPYPPMHTFGTGIVPPETNWDVFKNVLKQLLDDLGSQAASGGLRKYAQDSRPVDLYTLYAAVMCSPDLSDQQCSDCLVTVTRDLNLGCVEGYVWAPSCQVTYNNSRFFNPIAAPFPSPPPETGNKCSSNVWAAVGFSIALAVLIGVSVFLTLKWMRNQSPESRPGIIIFYTLNRVTWGCDFTPSNSFDLAGTLTRFHFRDEDEAADEVILQSLRYT